MRRGIEEIFLEGKWDEAVTLANGLSLFSDVVPGWAGPSYLSKKSSNGDAAGRAPLDAPASAGARPKAEEIWRRLLEPLPGPERAAAAGRLNFSRKLRRAAGVPA
jgi:hypothetical protein